MTSFSSGFDYRLFACRSAYPQRGGNIARAHGSCYLYESTIDYFWVGSGTPVWSGQVVCMGWVKIAYARFALPLTVARQLDDHCDAGGFSGSARFVHHQSTGFEWIIRVRVVLQSFMINMSPKENGGNPR